MLIDERAGPRRREVGGPKGQDRGFAVGRATALDRLVRAGMPLTLAEGWIAAWDVSTAGLIDFRAAADFWELGYRYAVEEYRRGHRPPVAVSS
jgi:hypothetical protein